MARTKVQKVFLVKYNAELMVTATSPKEAFEFADEMMIDMVNGDTRDLDEIFTITVENSRIHMVDEYEFSENSDECDDDSDDESDEDSDEDDESEEDSDDEDEDDE